MTTRTDNGAELALPQTAAPSGRAELALHQPAVLTVREQFLRLAGLERQHAEIGIAKAAILEQLAEQTSNVDASELLPLEDAAAIAGVTVRVLRSEHKKGRLELVGPRGHLRARRSALMTWMTSPARAKPVANDTEETDLRAAARAAVEKRAAIEKRAKPITGRSR